ncbi:MAG TPA: biopolymer transporter ExbD [Phycisphaerae bacterium]|nr:biopolymer transporter ExbD [Phycisphaerae bacterium]
MRIDRKSEEESIEMMNMTPMIDVVFNLLIFFLVGTRYAEIERDMNVNPPTARHAQPVTATPRELIVNVTQDGRYVIAGVEYTTEDLDRLFARAAKENPDQAVVIRGDAATMLQNPVNVLSLCEKYGIKRKFLTTINPGGP